MVHRLVRDACLDRRTAELPVMRNAGSCRAGETANRDN